MEKGKLLTTRLLDTHGKIGPFFFKEFIFVFLGATSLYFFVLFLSLFIALPAYLLIVLPASFLLMVGLVRLISSKKIVSPWYIHKWVLHRFLQPQSIIASSLNDPSLTLCFPINLREKKS